MALEQLFVASSGSTVAEGRKPAKSTGLRHAYYAGQELTLCGLTMRYLHAPENEKWSGKTPLRCTTCDEAASNRSAA